LPYQQLHLYDHHIGIAVPAATVLYIGLEIGWDYDWKEKVHLQCEMLTL
jgi:hypothetical protein